MTFVLNQERPRQFQVFSKGIHPGITSIMGELFARTELSRLAALVENNPYHDFENVLEHLQSVFVNCQELLSLDFITSPEFRSQVEAYLTERIDEHGKYSRKDLLLMASGLHDIGKGVEKEDGSTYLEIIDEAGNTKAPGHEHAGGVLIPGLLSGFDVTPREIAVVQSLVDGHDTYSETYCRTNLTKDVKSDIAKIRSRQPMFTIELLLHIMADNWGAQPYLVWRDYFLNELFQDSELLA